MDKKQNKPKRKPLKNSNGQVVTSYPLSQREQNFIPIPLPLRGQSEPLPQPPVDPLTEQRLLEEELLKN